MKRLILALAVLCTAAVLSCKTTERAETNTLSASPAGWFVFSTNNGSITITGLSDEGKLQTSLVVPSMLGSLPVDKIAGNAFFYNKTVQNVVIRNGIVSIGDDAFCGCEKLTNVSLPDSVSFLGIGVFDSCRQLRTVRISAGLSEIGSHVFYQCSELTSAVIPESVVKIGRAAFGSCRHLTNLTLGGRVVSIDESAFSGCEALENLVLPDSVRFVGESAFSRCTGITNLKIGSGVTNIRKKAFYSCSALRSITMYEGAASMPAMKETSADSIFGFCPAVSNVIVIVNGDPVSNYGEMYPRKCFSYVRDGGQIEITGLSIAGNFLANLVIPGEIDGLPVRAIDENAFALSHNMRSISIPGSITSMGKFAFQSCPNLTKVTFGEGLKEIGYGAFVDCTGIGVLAFPGSLTTVGEKAFWRCTGITNVDFGNGVKTIGDSAFQNCSGLRIVWIPDCVKKIGGSAFQECSGLTGVRFGSGLTTIGSWSFCECEELKDVRVPDGVTSIGAAAFNNCSGLTNLVIGKSVNKIGSLAIYGCQNLVTIEVRAAKPPEMGGGVEATSRVFGHLPRLKAIKVPLLSVPAYRRASQWSEYASIIIAG